MQDGLFVHYDNIRSFHLFHRSDISYTIDIKVFLKSFNKNKVVLKTYSQVLLK